MKQGINIVLPVRFHDVDFEEIEKIEFVFKQIKLPMAPALKTSIYKADGTGEAVRRDDTDIVDVPWDADETFLFIPDSTVYMDTKITIKNSTYNPVTPIVSFKMDMTLFEEVLNDEQQMP